jgi:hypothetical protein
MDGKKREDKRKTQDFAFAIAIAIVFAFPI